MPTQKTRIPSEITMIKKSTALSKLVLASTFQCKAAGKKRARGAQSSAPNKPRNLSSLSAKATARSTAVATTKNRKKLRSQWRPFLDQDL